MAGGSIAKTYILRGVAVFCVVHLITRYFWSENSGTRTSYNILLHTGSVWIEKFDMDSKVRVLKV